MNVSKKYTPCTRSAAENMYHERSPDPVRDFTCQICVENAKTVGAFHEAYSYLDPCYDVTPQASEMTKIPAG